MPNHTLYLNWLTLLPLPTSVGHLALSLRVAVLCLPVLLHLAQTALTAFLLPRPVRPIVLLRPPAISNRSAMSGRPRPSPPTHTSSSTLAPVCMEEALGLLGERLRRHQQWRPRRSRLESARIALRRQ